MICPPDDLAQRVFALVESRGSEPAFTIYGADAPPKTWSLAALHHQALQVAYALAELDLSHSRVALAVTSGTEAVVLYLACQYAGLAPAMMPTPDTASEALAFAEIVAPLVTGFAPDCLLIGDRCAALLARADVTTAWAGTARVHSLGDLMARAVGRTISKPAPTSPTALAHYLFTSGTTGQPKTVALSRQAVVHNTLYVADRWDFHEGDCLPAIGAPFHSGALMVGIIMPLYIGAHSIILPPSQLGLAPQTLLEQASLQACTHIVAGDGVLRAALAAGGADRYPALRRLVIGGEPLSSETWNAVVDHFQARAGSNLEIRTAYGMTEAAGLIATSLGARPVSLVLDPMAIGSAVTIASAPSNGLHAMSCGRPSHGVELRIVDDQGMALDDGCLGAVEYRSPSQFEGYVKAAPNQASITALQAISRDAFFPTGDLGFVQDGDLFVLGRLKETLRSGALRQPASWLERLVQMAAPALASAHGVIVEAVALDAERPSRGGLDLVVLQEVPGPHDTATLQLLSARVAEVLFAQAPIASLRIVFFIEQSLPRLPTSAKKVRLRTKVAFEAGDLTYLHDISYDTSPHRLGDDLPSWRGGEAASAPPWRFDLDLKTRDRLASNPADLTDEAHAILHRALDSATSGSGFALVRGFAVEAPIDLLMAGLRAVSPDLGERVAQNSAGEEVVQVRDQARGEGARGYMSHASLAFHTDAPDLIALLCVRDAKKGGETPLVSAARIYQTLVSGGETQTLALLERGFHYAYPEQLDDPSAQLGPRIPVFSHVDGQLSCRYLRAFIELAETRFGIALSDVERAALDRFDAVANQADLRLDLRLAPGELLILNNHAVLHARSAFLDHEETARQRLLLRLWLMRSDPWPVLPVLRRAGRRFVHPQGDLVNA